MDSKIPSRISPCPIMQVIFEVRCEDPLRFEELLSDIIRKLRPSFGDNLIKLPIAGMPNFENFPDNNFKYQPHYQIIKDNFTAQFGPRSISVVCTENYPGWQKFKEKIAVIISLVSGKKPLLRPERLGLRYINFFESKIFDKLIVTPNINISGTEQVETALRSVLKSKKTLTIINAAEDHYISVGDKAQKGSILDVDTLMDKLGNRSYTKFSLLKKVEIIHDEEKRVFFSMLNKTYISTLTVEH